MSSESQSGELSSQRLEELAEIYGECTTYVSANDIESLRTELPAEDFKELMARLGFDDDSTEPGDSNAS